MLEFSMSDSILIFKSCLLAESSPKQWLPVIFIQYACPFHVGNSLRRQHLPSAFLIIHSTE